MPISNKEAAKIIEDALSLWNDLSINPDNFDAMTDHCHDVYIEALYIASKLKGKDGNIDA